MSEFEWRKGMRDLGGPVQPQNDLWLGIAAQIQAASAAPAATPSRRRWAMPLALAASVLVAFAAVVQVARHSRLDPATDMARADTALPALQRADAQLKALPNRDPRLAGAVIEVDAATRELQQSLQQQPDAVFLVGLLNRTYERRVKLARLAQASS